jgi:hypothetical protein
MFLLITAGWLGFRKFKDNTEEKLDNLNDLVLRQENDQCQKILKMLSEKNKDAFIDWVNNDNTFVAEFNPEKAKEAVKMAKKAFINIANEGVFPNIPPTGFIVNLQQKRQGAGGGRIGFIPKKEITLFCDSDDDCMKKKTLNEVYTQQIRYVNNQRSPAFPDGPIFKMPFVTNGATLDYEKMEKFASTINQATATINKYQNFLETNKKLPKDFLEAVKTYSPSKYLIAPDDFSHGIKTKILARTSAKHFTHGPNYPSSATKTFPMYGHIVEPSNEYYYTHAKDETPESKAQGFISDMLLCLQAIENPRGPYASKTREEKIDEIGSFLFEVPTDLLKIIAPEFYNYMCRFFTEEEYSPSLRLY